VGIEFGVKGPTFGICSGGASAAHTITLGCDYIRHGQADIVVVGGSDSAITLGAILASQALHLLSPKGCFPFSNNRNGTVLAEAAGVLVMESYEHACTRGAQILSEIWGFGLTSSSTHMMAPDVEGMSEAMRRALQDAELDPTDIGHINAQGSATRANDLCETEAIKRVFGAHSYTIGVSATKSMHGNAMGASGAIEAIACVEALRQNLMPPTIGLSEPDPECDLDYVPFNSRAKPLSYAMSNSFALSGLNAAIVFGSPPG